MIEAPHPSLSRGGWGLVVSSTQWASAAQLMSGEIDCLTAVLADLVWESNLNYSLEQSMRHPAGDYFSPGVRGQRRALGGFEGWIDGGLSGRYVV